LEGDYPSKRIHLLQPQFKLNARETITLVINLSNLNNKTLAPRNEKAAIIGAIINRSKTDKRYHPEWLLEGVILSLFKIGGKGNINDIANYLRINYSQLIPNKYAISVTYNNL
jgi:hypothetical protein